MRLSLLFFAPAIAVWAKDLTDAQLNTVAARIHEKDLQSWEIGTLAQAILELNATLYSSFTTKSLPPPKDVPDDLTAPLAPLFEISRDTATTRGKLNNKTEGTPQPLTPDGSAADPASIGISVLLANWTGQDAGTVNYNSAAEDQLRYLLEDTPRTPDGAISHRESEVQIWSDFVFMVPPFLAYYGVTTRNRTLLAEAFNQIKLYRQELQDPKTKLWRHVVLGDWQDYNIWTTGLGWAAKGMLLVQATLRKSEYANTFKSEIAQLTSWVEEIHANVFPLLDESHIFLNWVDNPNRTNFPDASGTTLLADTVYRTAVENDKYDHLPFAERIRNELLSTTSDSDTGFDGYKHFTKEGWLTPVVNPHTFSAPGEESAEGQAFVIMMHAAWKRWEDVGGPGIDGKKRKNGAVERPLSLGLVAGAVGLGLAFAL